MIGAVISINACDLRADTPIGSDRVCSYSLGSCWCALWCEHERARGDKPSHTYGGSIPGSFSLGDLASD